MVAADGVLLAAEYQAEDFGDNSVMRSVDGGETWTAHTITGLSGTIDTMAYGAGRVLVFDWYRVAYSDDYGVTWTYVGELPDYDGSTNDSAYGNGTFVCVQASNAYYSTDNGETWFTATPAVGANLVELEFGAGLFVALRATATNNYYTSPDGVTWTTRTFPQTLDRLAFTWTGQNFVLFAFDPLDGYALVVFTSPDGLVWTQRTAPEGLDDPYLIASTNGIVLTFADNESDLAAISHDHGVTWETASYPVWGNNTNGLLGYDGRFLAVNYMQDYGTFITLASQPFWTGFAGAEEVTDDPDVGPSIQFGMLTSSPQTFGDALFPLPKLQFVANSSAYTALFELPPLGFVATGSEGLGGELVMELPGLTMQMSSITVGMIVTYEGSLMMRLPALKASFWGVEELPLQASFSVMELPPLGFVATEAYGRVGDLVMVLPAVEFRAFETAGNYLVMELPPMRFVMTQQGLPIGFFSLLPQPMMSVLGSSTWVVSSNFHAEDSVIDEMLFVLRSNLKLTDLYSPLAKFTITLESNLVARDFVAFVLDMVIDETLTLTDTPEITPEAIMSIVSQLMLQDQNISLMNAIIVVTSALVVLDRVRHDATVTITSAADFADQVVMHQTLIARIVSDLVMTDAVSGGLLISAMVSSELVLEDGFTGLLTALMTVEDGLGLAVRLTLPGSGGGEYTGYALNTRNAAMSKLDYPFSSFATLKLGGKQLTIATKEDGVYTIGGDTFDGDPINSKLRLGISDFGSSQLKRFANGFIGYTSNGSLVLKTITTDGGKKKENWYKLKPRSADSPVDGRFDIAKGLTARYWGWQIENLDGADFQIDSVKVWLMLIQRRKSGR